MVFNNNKKGQAAIEFLMTYGWMLLVVLIVGALIFSFVDFGSLLPNKLELNNNLLPDVAESSAIADDSVSGNGSILISFKYTGTNSVSIDPKKVNITYNGGITSCGGTLNAPQVYNGASDTLDTNFLQFRSGHIGYVLIRNCLGFDKVDAIEGTVKIMLTSTARKIDTPSTGAVRIKITK